MKKEPKLVHLNTYHTISLCITVTSHIGLMYLNRLEITDEQGLWKKSQNYDRSNPGNGVKVLCTLWNMAMATKVIVYKSCCEQSLGCLFSD